MGRETRGGGARARFGQATLLGVSLLALMLGGMTAEAQVTPPQATEVTVSVPAGPLEAGMLALGRQTNLRLVYPSALTQGRRTDGVGGRLSPRDAVARLLAGSGLQYSFTGQNTVRIFTPEVAGAAAQAPADAIMLDRVDVRGESAWGPVNGIVAHQSATGTKTDTALIETPQSISVVPKQMIEDLGARSVSQALRYNAGVLPDNAGFETRFDWLNIRGFSASTLGIYQDGLRLQSNTEFQVDPYALERIEVLRGPTSVLYGQNAPGGLVNMVTKRPLDTPFNEVQLSGGSFNNKQLSFDSTGPIDAAGQWLYRVTGMIRDSDTQVDSTPNDRVYIAPAITWRPSSDTTITVQSSYQKDNVGFGQFLPAYGTALPNPNGQIPVNRFVGEPGYDKIAREQTMVGYKLEHHFGDSVTFRQNARYAHLDYNVRTDGYGFGFVTVDAANPSNPRNFRSLSRLPFTDQRQADVFGIDNQLQGKFETGPFSHVLLGGFDYYDYSEQRNMWQGTARNVLDLYAPSYGTAAIASLRQTTGTDTHLKQAGLYIQDQITYDKHWVLTLGARQDWASQTVNNQLKSVTTEQSDAAATYRAGLTYLSDFGVAPYVSYSESFQPNIGTDRNGGQFAPSFGKQYEVGVKYQPPGSNSFITASVFDIRMTNVLVTDPVNALFSIPTGEMRSKGVELEAVSQVNDNLKVMASYTHVNITNSATTDAMLLGKVPPQQPRDMAAVWADYTFKSGVLDGFGLGAGVRYAGPTYIDQANLLPQAAGRTLVDMVLHYQYDRHWRFQVDASNIFDKAYAICVTATQCAWGARRTVIGSVKYTW